MRWTKAVEGKKWHPHFLWWGADVELGALHVRLLGEDHGFKHQLGISACSGRVKGVCCEKVTSNFNQDRRKGTGNTVQPDREPATLSPVTLRTRAALAGTSLCPWRHLGARRSSLLVGNVPPGAPAAGGTWVLIAIVLGKFSVHGNAISCAEKVGNYLLNWVKNARLMPFDYFVRLKKEQSNSFKEE